MIDYEKDAWKNQEGYRLMDRFKLTNKKAFVTGGAGGIGRNVAAGFAEAGADVALVDIPSQKENLEKLAMEMHEKYGTKIVPICCDVSKTEDVAHMKEVLLKELGTVDVAFINAGIADGINDHQDISPEDWNHILSVNLTGAHLTAQAAHQIMREHKHGGSIIFTSSMTSLITNEYQGTPTTVMTYGTTKAGMNQMCRALAASLAKDGIRCNAIAPGYVWSGIMDGRMPEEFYQYFCGRIPMQRFGRNDEMQGLVLFLASDASSYVTGTVIPIDGGYTVF